MANGGGCGVSVFAGKMVGGGGDTMGPDMVEGGCTMVGAGGGMMDEVTRSVRLVPTKLWW